MDGSPATSAPRRSGHTCSSRRATSTPRRPTTGPPPGSRPASRSATTSPRRRRASGSGRRVERLRRGLPELDPVPVGIFHPAEPAEALHRLDVVDDDGAAGPHLGEHRVEVTDAEVDHDPLLAPAEVLGVVRERRPYRRARLLAPDAVLLLGVRVDPERLAVPARGPSRVLRPDEQTADARRLLHARPPIAAVSVPQATQTTRPRPTVRTISASSAGTKATTATMAQSA